MRTRKIISFMGLLAIAFLFISGAQVWAGGAEGVGETPADATFQGPELWGTLIVDCRHPTLTIRVKRINDCEVEPQIWATEVAGLNFCEGVDFGENTPEGWTFGESGALFGIQATPAITKAKNFAELPIGSSFVYTWDVQIKFY